MSQYIPGTYAYTIQMFTPDDIVVTRHRVMGQSKDRVNLSGLSMWWPKHRIFDTHNEAIRYMINRLESMLIK